jgi:adenylate cyclase
VTLAPLTADEINSLLQNLLQPYGASATLAALIRERTGGNPFFVEELVRTMQMQGLLTIQGGMYTVATGVQTTLPVSIQGLVQARLDRLPVEDKHLLQMAAVIGPKCRPTPPRHVRAEEDLH